MRERGNLRFFRYKQWRNSFLMAGASSFAEVVTANTTLGNDNNTATMLNGLAACPLDPTVTGSALVAGLLNKIGGYLLLPYFEGNEEKASQMAAIVTGFVCTTAAALFHQEIRNEIIRQETLYNPNDAEKLEAFIQEMSDRMEEHGRLNRLR